MRTRPAVAAAAALALATTLGLTAATAGAAPTGRAAPERAELDRSRAEAARTLAAAEDLASGEHAPEDPGEAHAHGREATLVLRDLMLQRQALTGAERRRADAMLSRPTAPGGDGVFSEYTVAEEPPLCGPNVCVHYVASTADAPDLTDGPDAGTTPDYVDTVLATLEQVHAAYVTAGYRAPLADGVLGGDARTDIYLADIGHQGVYGYCTSDQTPIGPPWAVWAFCVLDDDYAAGQFPFNTPLENMQVTAAHEYFHAVQFAYDIGEDTWLMESTATWAEDELFDGVNDNTFYLPFGQLGNPATGPNYVGPTAPLDGSFGLNVYGNWVFFRYLTERYPAKSGGMPVLMRKIWEKADDAPGGPANYSLQAVKKAVQAVGPDFGKVYAGFADGNLRPSKTYDEGRAQGYPTPPLADRTTLTKNRRAASAQAILDHLSSASMQVKPGRGIRGKAWKLLVVVDMAARKRGSHAVVTVLRKSGKAKTHHVRLDKKGNGRKSVPFDGRKVRNVQVTLVNASTRTGQCWTDGSFTYSCAGVPKDDNLKQKVRFTARR